jgi:hypothetical protein
MIDIDYRKKGVIIIGTPRSGSHMVCDMLYNQSTVSNKAILGELYVDFNISSLRAADITINLTRLDSTKFIFCSIVQNWAKNFLAMNKEYLKDFVVINLRRRDKVAQYISWCVHKELNKRGDYSHSPDWNKCKEFLPIAPTLTDLCLFIAEQNLDFAFTNPAAVLYYEDMIKTGLYTRYSKNICPFQPEEIITDYSFVKDILEKYSYNGR